MRDIKFRAKIINEDRWVYGGGVWTFGEESTDLKTLMLHPNENGTPTITFVNPETVGEFTGLIDKNTKEIWEGDIVKAFIDFGPGGEKEFTFEVKVGPWGVNIEKWNYDEGKLPEVIGNIHDNPELMEVINDNS